MTSTAYIGLGSNIGNPESHIRAALDQLKQHPDIQLDKVSSLYQTPPVGYLNQADFINAVAKIYTRLSPQGLLQVLLDIELNHGRERPFKDAPRTLDLDLLLFDQIEMDTPTLTLPHPRMSSRGFVLVPLAETEPQIDIPKQGKVSDLIAQISTTDIIKL